MNHLKAYFLFYLLLYIFLSLQNSLWFYAFPFTPSPQVWLSFLVYTAFYANKKSTLAIAFIISLFLNPYSLLQSIPLFFSILSYGYIILYTKNTMLTPNIKNFFICSLFGFIFIKIFYRLYNSETTNMIEYVFNSESLITSAFTSLSSLFFFYAFKKMQFLKKNTNYSLKNSPTFF